MNKVGSFAGFARLDLWLQRLRICSRGREELQKQLDRNGNGV